MIKLSRNQEKFFNTLFQSRSKSDDVYMFLNLGPEYGPLDSDIKSRYLTIRDYIRNCLSSDFNLDWLNTITTLWGNGPKDYSEVGDSYWRGVVDHHVTNGFVVPDSPKFRSTWFEEKLKERAQSYGIWLKYISSEDAEYIQSYFHAWILEGLVRIGKYNIDEQKFKKRRKNSMDGFIDLYPDCLAQAVLAMQKKIDNPCYQFQDNDLNQIFKNNKYPGFNTLYQYFYKEKVIRSGDLLEVYKETQGVWKKYKKESDAEDLSKILQAFPQLDWCTKVTETAKTQLKNGTLEIYFSRVPNQYINTMRLKLQNDPNFADEPKRLQKELERLQIWEEYGYPRLCIRTEMGMIIEARGCAEHQEMDESMSNTNILDCKLSEYGEKGEHFKSAIAKLKRFNKVHFKFISNQDLSNDDLVFVLSCPDKFLGMLPDKRIADVKFHILENLMKTRDFTQMDLTGCDLAGADLTGCVFTNAILDGVCLEGCVFEGTDLTGCNLTGANLNYATALSLDQLSSAKVDSDTILPRCYVYDGRKVILNDDSYQLTSFLIDDFDINGVNTLSGSNKYLRSINLDNINISNSDLSNSCLVFVNFINANLSEVDLRDASLVYCDLTGVDISQALLYGADLTRVLNISLEQIWSAHIDDTTKLPKMYVFDEATQRAYYYLEGDEFKAKYLCYLNLSNCDLKQKSFTGSRLDYSDLTGANMFYTDFFQAILEGVNLSNSSCVQAYFEYANLTKANFTNANLRDAELQNTNLLGTVFDNADMRGANLKGVHNLTVEQLNKARLDSTTILPEGFEYDPVTKTLRVI